MPAKYRLFLSNARTGTYYALGRAMSTRADFVLGGAAAAPLEDIEDLPAACGSAGSAGGAGGAVRALGARCAPVILRSRRAWYLVSAKFADYVIHRLTWEARSAAPPYDELPLKTQLYLHFVRKVAVFLGASAVRIDLAQKVLRD